MCFVIYMFLLTYAYHITGFATSLTRRVPLVEQEPPTLPEHLSSSPVFSWVRVTRSLDMCMFCRSLFVLLYLFFFWSLCCQFFFDIQILIAPLVSSKRYKRTNNDLQNIHIKLKIE
jgi:hypothetical protein